MLIKGIRVKRVYLSASIMAGVLAGTLLNLLIIVLQQAVAPPNALTLAVGQREGDTMFIGARAGSLWFEKETNGLIASYSPVFPIPARAGTNIAIDGAVYAVVSVDAGADTVRLQQTHRR